MLLVLQYIAFDNANQKHMSPYMEFQTEGFDRHTCTARKEGDWIVFECPECGYVRKMHRKTNEIKLVNRGDKNALHSGSYKPVGLQPEQINLN